MNNRAAWDRVTSAPAPAATSSIAPQIDFDATECEGVNDGAMSACTRIIELAGMGGSNHDGKGNEYAETIRLANAFESRGDLYRAMGDKDRAQADYQAALRLIPYPSNQEVTAKIAALRGGSTAAAIAATASPMPSVGEKQGRITQSNAATAGGGASTPTVGDSQAKIVAQKLDRRVALVIGNSGYRAVQQLPNPSRDAELVGAALRSTGIEDVAVVHDLDRESTVAALKAFARKADSADWAIIYYAGHGIEIGGTNYLIPIDAKLETDRDVPFEAISLDQVQTTIEGAHKLKLIVLDACRDNPFAAQMKLTVANRSIGRGLSPFEPTGATLVVYAAKGGTSAADGEGDDSPFALSFARRIVEPGVEINKTLRFLRQDVLRKTGNHQEPFVYGSLPPDDFYFVPPK